MASEEFKEGSEQKRPNVQMGDPFMEKLLLEACLEAMQTGAVLGIQDMGAAGLTCSTCEMGARGGVGLEVELDNVPQREIGMSAYEIMLSESQERMLLVAAKGREHEVLSVFDKWGLDASIVGTVIGEPRMRILHHGEVVADIPNQSLTDDAPLYHRPVGTWKAPVPLDPPAEVLEELKKPRDYTADLKKLLASPNICSKRWVYEQYDTMVQTNTVQGPGGEAGVMRIKGTGTPGHERGLAMALAGNSRWCYLDPKLGAMHAVAEAARKVACTGATPVAVTNCLNFGNPEKPEIMAQLSAAIDGIAEACTALGTPITGGNVSLYNETRGEGIYPTPVLGVVGLLDDVSKAVPADFQQAGDFVIVIGPNARRTADWRTDLGSSQYAKEITCSFWGQPPALDLDAEAKLQRLLVKLADKRLIKSATDVSDGGLAITLVEAGFKNSVGVAVSVDHLAWRSAAHAFFCEDSTQVVVTATGEGTKRVLDIAEKEFGLLADIIGTTTPDWVTIFWDKQSSIQATISNLKQPWSSSLESALHDQTANEVLA
jgi:phosphoribosylformylglycinamidine synthase subunit PurL